MKGESTSGQEASWSVWRQDDNGNRFELAREITRKAAEAEVKEFEERGHKQAYWVEPTRRD